MKCKITYVKLNYTRQKSLLIFIHGGFLVIVILSTRIREQTANTCQLGQLLKLQVGTSSLMTFSEVEYTPPKSTRPPFNRHIYSLSIDHRVIINIKYMKELRKLEWRRQNCTRENEKKWRIDYFKHQNKRLHSKN